MRNEKKVDIKRYEDSFQNTEENEFLSNGEFGNLNLNDEYMNNVNNGVASFNNNFLNHNHNSDNFLLKMNVQQNGAKNIQQKLMDNNELSRYNSRSFSNAELEYFTNKKSEFLDLELNCTNKFLNMSQFDPNLNITQNVKKEKILISNNRLNGINFLLV